MPRQEKAKEQRMKRGQACLNCNAHHRACEGGIPCLYCVKTGAMCKRRSTVGPPPRTSLRPLAMKPPVDASGPSSSSSSTSRSSGSGSRPAINAPPRWSPKSSLRSVASSRSEHGPSMATNAVAGPSRRPFVAEEPAQCSQSLFSSPSWSSDGASLASGLATTHLDPGSVSRVLPAALPIIDRFLAHAQEFYYFLDTGLLKDLAMRDESPKHCPALSEAATLCGAKLLDPSAADEQTSRLRSRAVSAVVRGLDTATTPDEALRMLQAMVLIMNEGLGSNDLGTATLQIPVVTTLAATVLDTYLRSKSLPLVFHQSMDIVEMVYFMSQEVPQPLLSGVLASAVSTELLTTILSLPETLVCSPIGQPPIAGACSSDLSQVQHFVEGHPVGAHGPGSLSLPAMVVKGTMVLRQAVNVYTAYHSPPLTSGFQHSHGSDSCNTSMTEEACMDFFEYHHQACDVLRCLQGQLQQLDPPEGQDEHYQRTFGLAWALYSAATLAMFRIFVRRDWSGESQGICARSAQIIIEFAHTFVLGDDANRPFNPAYGVLVAMACRFLADLAGTKSQSSRARAWAWAVLTRGLGALERLAVTSSLLGAQLVALRAWVDGQAS